MNREILLNCDFLLWEHVLSVTSQSNTAVRLPLIRSSLLVPSSNTQTKYGWSCGADSRFGRRLKLDASLGGDVLLRRKEYGMLGCFYKVHA